MTTLVAVLGLTLAVMVWPARRRERCDSGARGEVQGSPTRAGETDEGLGLGRLGATLAPLRRRARPGDGGDDLAEFVELLALGLRTGLPPSEAIQIAMPHAGIADGEIRALAGQLSSQAAPGGSSPTLGPGVGRVTAPAGWSLLRAAWALSLERGSPLTEAVETSAAVLRARQASARRAIAARAGPRASMWLLTALPVAGPLAALLMGVDPRATFGEPLALASLLVGFGLTAAGWWWGSRIIRRAEAPTTWT